MEARKQLSSWRIALSIVGVALMLLLLFLLKPHIVAVSDFRGPICAAVVPKDETDLVGLLRGISFKEGWLYLAIYTDKDSIPRIIDKIHTTIAPRCIAVGIKEGESYSPYNGEIVFYLPSQKEELVKFIYKRSEEIEGISR